jgi:HK97 family phage prohead protease
MPIIDIARPIEYKAFAFEECKTEGDGGVFSGYASAYAKDLTGDKIAPGAFGKTIADRKGRVPILQNHDMDRLLGFSTSLAEDGKGLMMAGTLALGNTDANNAYQLLKLATDVGFRMGMSIGFNTTDYEWDDATGLRTIKEIELWEISLTPFPAQPKAFVADVKTFRELEKHLREVERFSKTDTRRILHLFADLNQSSGGKLDGANGNRLLRGLAQMET